MSSGTVSTHLRWVLVGWIVRGLWGFFRDEATAYLRTSDGR